MIQTMLLENTRKKQFINRELAKQLHSEIEEKKNLSLQEKMID